MPLIKSISGIRGTLGCSVGEGLSPLDVVKYTSAYAEVGWPNELNKDFDQFTIALVKMKKYWDKKGIYYLEE